MVQVLCVKQNFTQFCYFANKLNSRKNIVLYLHGGEIYKVVWTLNEVNSLLNTMDGGFQGDLHKINKS